MPFPDDQPRRHFYAFAHQFLPNMLFRHPEPFRTAALEGRAGDGLQKMWEKTARNMRATEDSLLPVRSTIHDCAGKAIVMIAPPHAEHIAEAHFIAVVLDRQDASFIRYFVLEHGWDVTGSPRTVLGEWTREGSHVNFGTGPEPNAESFLAAVCPRLADA